jgi:hypothetical protein
LGQGNKSGDKKTKMISLGTRTKFGKVSAIGFISGERYYFLINKFGVVSMMPAAVIEKKWKPLKK